MTVKPPALPLVQLTRVCRTYEVGPQLLRVLKDVDLSLQNGEFLALMGPSGSGKSTMLHIMGCLDRPTSGTVTIAGAPVSSLDDHALSAIRNQKLGFVFQAFHLIPRLSVLQNISVPLLYSRVSDTEASKRALAAASKVGLAERCRHGPMELSGGERQRVAIARALINDPVLVLADEPTGNLDAGTGREIMDLFRSLNEAGKTIVVVTHNPEVAEYAHRRITLEDGRITSIT